MNPIRTGGPPLVSLLGGLALLVCAGCSSTDTGMRADWSAPNPEARNADRVVMVTAQPSPPSTTWQPGPSQPRPTAPRPAPAAQPPQPDHPAQQAPRPGPSPRPTGADRSISSLPPAIIDDRHEPDLAPADRDHYRIIPESRAQVLYTVRKGDTLMSIAREYYGDDSAWRRIFQANRDILPSASEITPGMTLKMP